MKSALDTSVLLDVFGADPIHAPGSQRVLRQAMTEGALVICEVVLAELRPCFSSRDQLQEALDTLNVVYEPIQPEAACLAGETWKRYRQSGGSRDRLIPDFLIAAHAATCADRLVTRDRGFTRRWFRGLTLLEPRIGVL